jgi:hypothetical protein
VSNPFYLVSLALDVKAKNPIIQVHMLELGDDVAVPALGLSNPVDCVRLLSWLMMFFSVSPCVSISSIVILSPPKVLEVVFLPIVGRTLFRLWLCFEFSFFHVPIYS